MYESYWGLDQKPFENSTDSKFYYPSESHQAALLKLRYVVENFREGAILTGAPGLGKSLIVQALFRNLPERVRPFVNLVFPQMPSDQLLAFLAGEFTGNKSTSEHPSINESVSTIQSFLQENRRTQQHTLVVIDEAHLIADNQTLDTLRLLLNFQYENTNALTLLFVGQPSLLPLLDRHRDLEERLTVKCLLRPLDVDESVAYVESRLAQAGADRPVFTEAALETLHRLSQGVPRQINRLCDLALLVGYAEEQATISAEAVEAVSEELVAVAPE